MKKYTKWVIGVVCALSLATSAFAAEKAADTSLFNAGEVGLTLSTGYVIDQSAIFQNEYNFNLSAGAFWFPFRNVGVEANVPFYQVKGVSVDEVQAGLLVRFPLAKETVFFKSISPYLGFGAVYNWQADTDLNQKDWAYVAKTGVEFRLNKKWSVFAEAQYRNDEFNKDAWNEGAASLQGGLKLVF